MKREGRERTGLDRRKENGSRGKGKERKGRVGRRLERQSGMEVESRQGRREEGRRGGRIPTASMGFRIVLDNSSMSYLTRG